MKTTRTVIAALAASLSLATMVGTADARGYGGYSGNSYDDHRDNGRRNGGDRFPNGNWSNSCRNASVRHGVLYAECQSRRGHWRNAVLDARGCRNVENDNGRLVCTK